MTSGRVNTKEEFHSRVSIGRPEECWPWKGSLHSQGYGYFSFNKKKEFSHRLAWRFHHQQEIPPGLVIMHSCDNPPCCNPHHLSLGTFMDNSQDMVRKGRCAASGERNLLVKKFLSKIGDDERVKALVGEGLSQRQIAKRLGVSREALRKRFRDINWSRGRKATVPGPFCGERRK